MQRSALFMIVSCLLVASGTPSASACSSFGRSDCTPRDPDRYSYSYSPPYGTFVDDGAMAYGYTYAPPPAYGYYPPPVPYGYYAAPPSYGYAYRSSPGRW